MTYQPKFSKCPYQSTSGDKCSHKKNGKYCGYGDVDDCDIYCEWFELHNDTILIEKAISLTTTTPQINTGVLT